MAIDASNPAQHADTAAQPAHRGFDHDHVPRMHRPPVADPFDAPEVGKFLAVLRLGENEDRAHLGDRLGQDRGRQHRQLAGPMRQVTLVERHVLDPDDALIGHELGDAVDEEERIAVWQDPFDRRVVERERDVHRFLSADGEVPTGSSIGRQRGGNLQV